MPKEFQDQLSGCHLLWSRKVLSRTGEEAGCERCRDPAMGRKTAKWGEQSKLGHVSQGAIPGETSR